MSKKKLPVVLDEQMETLAGIAVTSCTAFFDDDANFLKVVGEAKSPSGRPVRDYRSLQVAIYDADGDIVGRNYQNWGAFGIRQTFEFDFEDLPCEPAKVGVYPSEE